MRSVLKALLYAALLAACYWCGFSAYGDYAQLMMDDGDGLARSSRVKPGRSTNAPPVVADADETFPSTNAPAAKRAAAVIHTPSPGE